VKRPLGPYWEIHPAVFRLRHWITPTALLETSSDGLVEFPQLSRY
jgi:hypothetical protein